jgi:hypothetical protein
MQQRISFDDDPVVRAASERIRTWPSWMRIGRDNDWERRRLVRRLTQSGKAVRRSMPTI